MVSKEEEFQWGRWRAGVDKEKSGCWEKNRMCSRWMAVSSEGRGARTVNRCVLENYLNNYR